MKSMTAFSREDQSFREYQLSIEIKSVNHRFLDIHIRLPESLRFLELKLRENMTKQLSRGRVDVFIKMEPLENTSLEVNINESAIIALREASEKIQALIPNTQALKTTEVLHWKGVMQSTEFDETQLAVDASILFEEAMTKLIDARQQEGEKIQTFLNEKLDELLSEKQKVMAHLPEQSDTLRQRISDKLADIAIEIDKDRFEQEVLFYLNRIDVNEELERLEVHLQQCKKLLNSKKPVGRKLDFMMQELQREANTLGTKSTMIEIKNASMAMKVAIEQIREQVQNIE